MNRLSTNILQPDLKEFSLPATAWSFIAQDLSAVAKAQGFRVIGKPRGYGLGNERSELRAQRQNVAFAINEAVKRIFQFRPHAFRKNVVVVKNRWNDLFVRPRLEHRKYRAFDLPAFLCGLTEENLSAERNLGECFHGQTMVRLCTDIAPENSRAKSTKRTSQPVSRL